MERAKRIKITDKVLIQSGEGRFNRNPKLFGNKYARKWSKELGQIIGWMIGDGWIRENKKDSRVGFSFGKEDLKIFRYLKPIINELYKKEIKEVIRRNNVVHLSYHSKKFVEFFKKLGVKITKAEGKRVPGSLFTAPREAVIGFLQGLFSADGTISVGGRKNTNYIRLSAKSKELLEDVQLLLLNLGIKSKIYERHRKRRLTFMYKNIRGELRLYESDGILYELQISKNMIPVFLEKVGFLCDKHHEKTKELRKVKFHRTFFEDRIISIEPNGKKIVYDLNEIRTNSFIANGIVIHNCGEQPLLDYESCNLGSISLPKFVEDGEMNYGRLGESISTYARFLDNIIDVNNLPLPKIEEMTQGNRKIGLGVMGWAEALVKMGISYDSEEAIEKGKEVMRFVNETALEASAELAKERGVFPNYKGSVYDGQREVRNATRTTIAPTGTIAIAAGLQGSGIEPFFTLAYRRYNAAAIDARKEGREPDEKDVFYEANPLLREMAEQNNWYGFGSEREMWDRIIENEASVEGLDEIPKEVQRLFVTAHNIEPKQHIRMQAAFQRYTDNAVSKTINFRKETTVREVKEAYKLAYSEGLKGITIYVDGSKEQQVLNLEESVKPLSQEDVVRGFKENGRPKSLVGIIRREKYGDGNKLYVTMGHLLPDKKYEEVVRIIKEFGALVEVFGNSSYFDPKAFSAMTAHGKAISKMLQGGFSVDEVANIFLHLPDGSIAWETGYRNLSVEDAVAHAMLDYPRNGGRETNFTNSKNTDPELFTQPIIPECPSCHSSDYKIIYQGGCRYYSCCMHSDTCS